MKKQRKIGLVDLGSNVATSSGSGLIILMGC